MGVFNRRSKGSFRHADPSLTAGAAPAQAGRNAGEAAPGQYKSWQDEAWQMYDDVGEFRQGVTWLSNVLSRARLIPARAPERPGDEPTPIDPDSNDPAIGLVQSIGGGIGGQSSLLRSGTVQLTVPGEGWFVGQVDETKVPDLDEGESVSWKFYSRDEVKSVGEGDSRVIKIRVNESRWVDLPRDGALPIRVWREHERYHWRADSSTRAALPILRRLELLNRKIDAQILSRLANNGVWLVPKEIDFPRHEGYEDVDDPFVAEFIDLASTAIRTPGSAMAAIPMVISVAGDKIAQFKYEEFAHLVDPSLLADREFEIKRLSTAIDVPAEVLLGMVGMNHWGAIQVEESALKTTVTSLLELICWSTTTGYLAPAFDALRDPARPHDQDLEGVDLTYDRMVWYDLSELTVRPDRSTSGLALHERGAITNVATAREVGFEETDFDVPPDELKHRIGVKLAMGGGSEQTIKAGLTMLGFTAEAALISSPAAPAPAPVEGQPATPANENEQPTTDNAPEPATPRAEDQSTERNGATILRVPAGVGR